MMSLLSVPAFAEENYEILNPTIELEVGSGDIGVFQVYVKNTGNETLTFDPPNFYGNTSILIDPIKNLTVLYINETDVFVGLYEIPEEMFGTYSSTIEFDSGRVEKTFTLGINVTDITEPNILQAEITPVQEVTRPVSVRVRATDNVGVKYVNTTFSKNELNKTITLDYSNETEEWSGSAEFESIGDWKVLISVVDGHNNIATEEIWIKIENIKDIEKYPSVNFGLGKVGNKITKPVIFLERPADLYFDIKEIKSSASNTSNFTIKLITPNTIFDLQEVAQIDLKNQHGLIQLEVYSDENITFNGRIELISPDYLDFKQTIFHGIFTDYKICERVNEMFLGHPITLEPIWNGNKDNSYCLLTEKLPIDTEWKDVQGFASSMEEFKTLIDEKDQNYNDCLSGKRTCESNTSTVVTVIITFAIIIGIVYGVKNYYQKRGA